MHTLFAVQAPPIAKWNNFFLLFSSRIVFSRNCVAWRVMYNTASASSGFVLMVFDVCGVVWCVNEEKTIWFDFFLFRYRPRCVKSGPLSDAEERKDTINIISVFLFLSASLIFIPHSHSIHSRECDFLSKLLLFIFRVCQWVVFWLTVAISCEAPNIRSLYMQLYGGSGWAFPSLHKHKRPRNCQELMTMHRRIISYFLVVVVVLLPREVWHTFVVLRSHQPRPYPDIVDHSSTHHASPFDIEISELVLHNQFRCVRNTYNTFVCIKYINSEPSQCRPIGSSQLVSTKWHGHSNVATRMRDSAQFVFFFLLRPFVIECVYIACEMVYVDILHAIRSIPVHCVCLVIRGIMPHICRQSNTIQWKEETKKKTEKEEMKMLFNGKRVSPCAHIFTATF